jgi:hypothetical protein
MCSPLNSFAGWKLYDSSNSNRILAILSLACLAHVLGVGSLGVVAVNIWCLVCPTFTSALFGFLLD